MNKRQTFTLTIIFIVALFGVPLLLKMPAFWSVFDYSKANDLATAISGLTTPIISLVSIVLIYLAFTKQREANQDLRSQTLNSQRQVQIEIINSLFEQLNKEIETYGHFKNKQPFTGRLAFIEIGDLVRNSAKKNSELSLTDDGYGESLIAVATIYSLLFDAIENGVLSPEQKNLYKKRAIAHLRSMAGIPIFKSWLAYRENPEYFDSSFQVIINLIESYFPDRFEILKRNGIK